MYTPMKEVFTFFLTDGEFDSLFVKNIDPARTSLLVGEKTDITCPAKDALSRIIQSKKKSGQVLD